MTISHSEHQEVVLLERIAELIREARIARSCISCEQLDEPAEGCRLAGGARPPARTIAGGCGQWTEKVPF